MGDAGEIRGAVEELREVAFIHPFGPWRLAAPHPRHRTHVFLGDLDVCLQVTWTAPGEARRSVMHLSVSAWRRGQRAQVPEEIVGEAVRACFPGDVQVLPLPVGEPLNRKFAAFGVEAPVGAREG